MASMISPFMDSTSSHNFMSGKAARNPAAMACTLAFCFQEYDIITESPCSDALAGVGVSVERSCSSNKMPLARFFISVEVVADANDADDADINADDTEEAVDGVR
eukprot:Pompholyxophrys_punicea_v1_NODE_1092_length_967_cov_3.301370.p2 type:complete len:105 gc:universal NODE_1092_length_967_cov_3.301370:394-80(-)